MRLKILLLIFLIFVSGCSQKRRCCPPEVTIYNESAGCYSVDKNTSCPIGWNSWFD